MQFFNVDEPDEETETSEEQTHTFLDPLMMNASGNESTGSGYTLTPDVYTNFMLNCIWPSAWFSKVVPALAALLFMLFTAFLQLSVTHSVAMLVDTKRDMETQRMVRVLYDGHLCESPNIPTRSSPLNVELTCGTFNRVEEDADEIMPANWFADKQPVSSWNPSQWDPNDLPRLQKTMYQLHVLNENGSAFYAFIAAFMAWTAAGMAELMDICWFVWYALSLPAGTSVCRNNTAHDGGVRISRLGLAGKLIVILIAAVRLPIAVFLYWTGCRFLQGNVSSIDVILNAVALTFILELDVVLFRAANLLARRSESIERVTIASVTAGTEPEAPHPMSTLINHCAHVCLFLILVLSAALNFIIQKSHLALMFEMYASFCLYFGAPPNLKQYFTASFPVASFCEAVLRCMVINQTNCVFHKNSSSNPYHNLLVTSCLQMRQPWNNTSGAEFPTRETDQDLAEVNLSDPAANFWCPNLVVRQKLGLDCINPYETFPTFSSFWENSGSCVADPLGGSA